jgi:hypothetical protein
MERFLLWETRVNTRRLLLPLALFASVTAVTNCRDTSPLGVQTPNVLAARAKDPGAKQTGLVACSQTYDSVTKVIGPTGDSLRVGNHILWIDSLSLTEPVTITAVAPAGSVRWVRFQPEGLVFQPGFYAKVNGLSAGAALYTNYKNCGVALSETLRIAQVTDSLGIVAYLQTYVLTRKNPWSQANQYVTGLLPHFSNYAVAW